MERNSSGRKRKGISVSLTPQKNNDFSHERSSQSPMVQNFSLNQSPMPNQGYKFSSPLVQIPKPVVHFKYSTISKEEEVREGLALDREIYELRKQLQNKKSYIKQLQSKKISNPSNIHIIDPCVQKQLPRLNILPPQQKLQPAPEIQNQSIVKQVVVSKRQSPKKEQVTVTPNRVIQANKENNEKILQRKKDLQWAEQKLLDIIKVCQHGL